MNIVFIESFDDGSHRAFREGFARHSRHQVRPLTLPGRHWKWRMRGAAPWFAAQLASVPEPCDLIVATSLLDVAHLRGLLPTPLDRCPLVLYMHENQLTYPTSPQQRHDHQLGLTNIVSCLAADRVVFNSRFQRDAFLAAIPAFLERMPDAVPTDTPARIAARGEVLPVGLDCEPRGAGPGPGPRERPLLLWNHRWEFDKRPDQFAQAIGCLLDAGLDFDVVLLGDGRGRERVFAPLVARLGDRCLHAGYLDDRQRYAAWLAAADVVISCAEQENFGIAVAEAVHAGCYPVLPRRQVYPELYGSRCPGPHFYDDDDQLLALLTDLVAGHGEGHACPLAGVVEQFCWRDLAPRYDDLLSEVSLAGGKAR